MNTDFINDDNIEKWRAMVWPRLSPKRRLHTEGVVAMATRLSEIHGVNVKKAQTAAFLHDWYRNMSVEETECLAKELGLSGPWTSSVDLAHGKIAAAIIRRDNLIEDEEIIDAVAYHTTGRKGMSLLEKIIYVADGAEEGRNYEGVDELRRLAVCNIHEACRWLMEHTVDYLTKKGKEVDALTVEALKSMEKERGQMMNSKELVTTVARRLDEKKGEDIYVIDIGGKSSLADYFILVSGGSERKIAALADQVQEAFAISGIEAKGVEGNKESGWILMDYGDVIVNVLTREMREKYNIEKLWNDCDTMDNKEFMTEEED